MRRSKAFCPGHITGFFQICDEAMDPLKQGSRGAGVAIELGVVTSVEVGKGQRNRVEIRIDGNPVRAQTSRRVVNHFLSLVKGRWRVKVEHEFGIPIGYGFGASGAGALSLALALNEAFDLGLSKIEASRVAHLSEVECKTGLGDVIAQWLGGLEIRKEPGAPGIGRIKRIPIKQDFKLLSLCFAPLATKKILSNPFLKERINRAGAECVKELLRKPTPENFMLLSQRFSQETGLLTPRMRKVMEEVEKEGFIASMVMLGEALFAVVEEEKVKRIKSIFGKRGGEVIVASVDFRGARTLSSSS
jgi:pantoate kinase